MKLATSLSAMSLEVSRIPGLSAAPLPRLPLTLGIKLREFFGLEPEYPYLLGVDLAVLGELFAWTRSISPWSRTSLDCLRKAMNARIAVARARTASAKVATAVIWVAKMSDITEA